MISRHEKCDWLLECDKKKKAGFSHWSVQHSTFPLCFPFLSKVKRESVEEVNAAAAATIDEIATAGAAPVSFVAAAADTNHRNLCLHLKSLCFSLAQTQKRALSIWSFMPKLLPLDSLPTSRCSVFSPSNSSFCQCRTASLVTSPHLWASALISTDVGRVGTASPTAGHGDQYAVGSPAAFCCSM